MLLKLLALPSSLKTFGGGASSESQNSAANIDTAGGTVAQCLILLPCPSLLGGTVSMCAESPGHMGFTPLQSKNLIKPFGSSGLALVYECACVRAP